MDNQEKALLRQISLAEDLPSSKRLDALDRLAAADGVYFSRRYPDPGGAHLKPPNRSRKFIVTGLRRLLKTKRPLLGTTKAGILSRLMILKTGRDLVDDHNREYLRVPTPGPDAGSRDPNQPERQSDPVVSSTVTDIQRFLEEHGGADDISN